MRASGGITATYRAIKDKISDSISLIFGHIIRKLQIYEALSNKY